MLEFQARTGPRHFVDRGDALQGLSALMRAIKST
jgi:hypothetical protein